MSKKLILLVVVLVLATVSFAQNSQAAAAAKTLAPSASVGPATTTCAATYTSGSGHNATTYCVTANGNIPQFSRGGKEYLQVGTFDEGYGICDFTTNIGYDDYAWTATANWGAATFTQPNLRTAVSTRTTSDGIWKLTNTITQVPAKPTAPGQASVKMAVKNLTGVSRTIYLTRHADVDAESTTSGNDFDYTIDTASGLLPGFKSGLASVNGTYNFSYDAFALNNCCNPDPCNPGATRAVQPFVGDGSVEQLWLFAVPAGGTRTVTMFYNPI